MGEAEFSEPAGLVIHQSIDPELRDEATKFSGGKAPFGEVYEMDLHPSFREKPECLAGIRTFARAEDLHVDGLLSALNHKERLAGSRCGKVSGRHAFAQPSRDRSHDLVRVATLGDRELM